MKILYLLREEPDATGKKIIEEQKKSHEVTVLNLRENRNYDQIVDLIASHDRTISW
ncbi:MAG TPA: hypothetical protein VEI96_06505 [Thermodesulfovibrionales bacterium]|nr:hypothetical protein [Thermodesulfovibrionales bacterium]